MDIVDNYGTIQSHVTNESFGFLVWLAFRRIF
jgi:hypothetical protein